MTLNAHVQTHDLDVSEGSLYGIEPGEWQYTHSLMNKVIAGKLTGVITASDNYVMNRASFWLM